MREGGGRKNPAHTEKAGAEQERSLPEKGAVRYRTCSEAWRVLAVSTGGRRNARRLHGQSGEADIRRTLAVLRLSAFLSSSLSPCLSPLRRCSEARARYLQRPRTRTDPSPIAREGAVQRFCRARCAAVRVCDRLLLRCSSGSAASVETEQETAVLRPALGTSTSHSRTLGDSTVSA